VLSPELVVRQQWWTGEELVSLGAGENNWRVQMVAGAVDKGATWGGLEATGTTVVGGDSGKMASGDVTITWRATTFEGNPTSGPMC
jgi:hypothetical protein